MYPAELEIKDTSESTTSASYLDLLLSIGMDTSHFHQRQTRWLQFPYNKLSVHIPSSPVFGDFISQLIRYARACSSYECFILRDRRLSSKLLKHGYLVECLKSSSRKFLSRYGLPLTNVKWHSGSWPTVTSQPIRLSTNSMTLIPSVTFTELWVVSMEHLQRVWHASRERLPFRTPCLSFYATTNHHVWQCMYEFDFG